MFSLRRVIIAGALVLACMVLGQVASGTDAARAYLADVDVHQEVGAHRWFPFRRSGWRKAASDSRTRLYIPPSRPSASPISTPQGEVS